MPETAVLYPTSVDTDMDIPPDQRSPIAIGIAWASRVMTISLTMVLPGLGGYWVDDKLGTKLVFMLAGFFLGMAAAMWQLLQLARHAGGGARSTDKTARSDATNRSTRCEPPDREGRSEP